MSMLFAPLPSTTENQYFQGVWSRMFGAFIESARGKAGLAVEPAAGWPAWCPEVGVDRGRRPAPDYQAAAPLDRRGSRYRVGHDGQIVLMCRQAWGVQ